MGTAARSGVPSPEWRRARPKAVFGMVHVGATCHGCPGACRGRLRAGGGAADASGGRRRVAGIRGLLERRRQPPDHSPRCGSPGLDHRPERNDAARGPGAPRRRIPLGGDRARRQRHGTRRAAASGRTSAATRCSANSRAKAPRRKTASPGRSWAAPAGMPARRAPMSSPGSYVIEAEDGSIQGRAVGLKGRVRPGQPTAGGARP